MGLALERKGHMTLNPLVHLHGHQGGPQMSENGEKIKAHNF